MSTSTTRFVVLAEFNIKPGTLDAFLELANKEHCYAFDALIQEGNSSRSLSLSESSLLTTTADVPARQPIQFLYRDEPRVIDKQPPASPIMKKILI